MSLGCGRGVNSRVREQRKVDRVGDGLETSFIRVEMIATVICRQILRWMKRVVCSRILIDHSIAATCLAANKGIDLFASRLACQGPVSRPLIWR